MQQLPVADLADEVPVRIIFVVRLVVALGGVVVLKRLAAGDASVMERITDTRLYGNEYPLAEVLTDLTDAVFVADVNAARTRNLTGSLRADPGGAEWLSNDVLLMQLTVGGRNALVRVNPQTGAQTEVIGGRRRLNGFTYDKAKTKVAYVATAVDRPTELFLANIDGSGERQLTRFNEAIVERLK